MTDSPATLPVSGEIDRENEQFNQGVLHAVDLLAEWLEVTDYVGADGSEDYDTDLANTMLNILAAKGLLDRDEHVFATLPASHPQAPASGEVAKLGRVIRKAAREALFNGAGKIINPEIFEEAAAKYLAVLSPSQPASGGK